MEEVLPVERQHEKKKKGGYIIMCDAMTMKNE